MPATVKPCIKAMQLKTGLYKLTGSWHNTDLAEKRTCCNEIQYIGATLWMYLDC